VFKLYCGLGQCGLDRLVLNECEPAGSLKAGFTPNLHTWATWAGSLEVKRIGGSVVEARAHKFDHGRAATRLRFTYVPDLPFGTRVTRFEAVETDDPDVEQQASGAIEYVPLRGTSLVSLGCPLVAKGVEE
jgi:hypothetical protein